MTCVTELASLESTENRGMIPRTLAILRCFAGPHPVGVSEVQRKTGLPKATVHRTLHELARAGLLQRTGARFQPGVVLFELGQLPSGAEIIRRGAVPHMNRLRMRSGCTATLAVLDGAECVYVEIIGGDPRWAMPQRTGGRWPAHASCSGKVLLAFDDTVAPAERLQGGLPRLTSRTVTDINTLNRELAVVRETGIAFDREESVPGLTGMAVPVITPSGIAVAAVAISSRSGRRVPNEARLLLGETAAAIVRSCAGALARGQTNS